MEQAHWRAVQTIAVGALMSVALLVIGVIVGFNLGGGY